MKTYLAKPCIWALFMGLASGTTWAQEWSFGPKAYLGLSKHRSVGDQVQIGSTLVSATDGGDAVGGFVGGFARYDRPGWYLQLEVVRGKYYLTNATISNSSSGFSAYPNTIRTDVRLLAGAKLLPWLRLSAGLTGARNQCIELKMKKFSEAKFNT